MQDTGSGVNSVPEQVVIDVLNSMRKKGIALSDRRHPIKVLEQHRKQVGLRGASAGGVVPLIGSVVFEQEMIEHGKLTGPKILVRYRICKKGATDWAPMIMGGRPLDCVERGGLGFMPGKETHYFQALGIRMTRAEDPCPPITGHIYAARLCALDSDDECEVGKCDLTELSAPGQPLVYEGEPMVLGPNEGVWIPVRRQGQQTWTRAQEVCLPAQDQELEAAPGLWPTGDREGMTFVCNLEERDLPLRDWDDCRRGSRSGGTDPTMRTLRRGGYGCVAP